MLRLSFGLNKIKKVYIPAKNSPKTIKKHKKFTKITKIARFHRINTSKPQNKRQKVKICPGRPWRLEQAHTGQSPIECIIRGSWVLSLAV